MSYTSKYIITTLSGSVQQYNTPFLAAQAPFIPTGRIRQPGCPSAPYTAINGTSKKFPLGRICYENPWVCGKVGNYGLNFDGTDDFVLVGPAAATDLTSFAWMSGKGNTSTFKFSISLWVKLDNPEPNDRYVFMATSDGSTGFIFDFEDTAASGFDRNLFCTIYNSSGLKVCSIAGGAQSYPNDTNWHNIVVTYDQSLSTKNGKMYIDGGAAINSNKTVNAASNATTNTQLFIGRRGSGDYFKGTLDDIAIWDYALTVQGVAAIYNEGIGNKATVAPLDAPGHTSYTITYLNFEDGPGSTTTTNYPSAGSASLPGVMSGFPVTTACEFPVKKQPW